MRVKSSAILTSGIAVRTRHIVSPGIGWSALGVLAFSGTFPATHVALEGFSPLFVGAGRSVVAAVGAAVCLRVGRAKAPRREDLYGLVIVACCVGFGFGLLSAIALPKVGVAASGVVVGLLPIATAIMATWRAGERPSLVFWIVSLAGAAMVVAFLFNRGGGTISTSDLFLLAAVAVAAIGYAESGRLTRTMPGWQVICWAVIFALPVTLPVAMSSAIEGPFRPGGVAALGFLYVSLVSMLLGFFAWNRGMAIAGIARASQVQLAQPLLTIGWAALFFGEPITFTMLGVAAGVVVCVAITRRVRIGSANRLTSGHEDNDEVDKSPHLLVRRTH